MENRQNPDLIRGIVIAEENHERTMNNQINFYKEALRNAQETSTNHKFLEEQPPQQASSNEQKKLSEDRLSDPIHAKRKTIIDIIKRGLLKLFS